MSSYQPYPTGGQQPYPSGGAGGGQVAQQPAQPSKVRIAMWLMYAGAALSLISAILVLALGSRIKNSIHNALVKNNATLAREGKKQLTASQMHTVANAYVVIIVIVLLIAVALWIWMAWANGKGKSWARIVASVLFGLNTIFLLIGISRAGSSTLFTGLGWLIGLAAIILLWMRESSAYFKPRQMY
jgi:hypothetical protein